jgi:hypothetical protein
MLGGASSIAPHMSSKMIDAYVREIALRLDEAQWREAERLATALPHIAIALSDPNLTSSAAAYRAWCTQWVKPDQGDDRFDQWMETAGQNPLHSPDGRPTGVFQTLGLTRRLRTSPPYPPRRKPEDDYGEAVTRDSQLLIAAFRSWYAAQGRSDQTVTMNLAKLGVLR